jgi:hypothetical protein
MKKTPTLFLIVFWASTSITPLLAQWVQTNGPYGAEIRCLAVSGTNLFAGTNGEGVFRSTDNGNSWTVSGLTNRSVYALAVLDNNLFAGTLDGVFLSTDNGTSWTRVGYEYTGLKYTSVRAFAISGTNIFAGTGGGGVFLSTNSGLSWAPAGLTHVNVRSLAVNGTNIFAGTNGSGVFCSTDSGKSWTEASTGLTFTYVYCLAVSPNGTGGINLFAGTWDGIFLSIDNGKSWIAVNTGLICTDISALAVSGMNLFAGTLDGVVWRRQLPEMVTSVEALSTNLPAHFSLSQNYPNPFNPVTTITFGLPSEPYVSLKVFDGLGREVAALISEELSAGNYAHKWNAESLPSGVYFYSMSAEPISGDRNDSFIETKKLILMK